MPRAMSMFCWREIPYSCGMMKLEMRLQARYLRDVCGVMLCDSSTVLCDTVSVRCYAFPSAVCCPLGAMCYVLMSQ
jgi:hypothetical protein